MRFIHRRYFLISLHKLTDHLEISTPARVAAVDVVDLDHHLGPDTRAVFVDDKLGPKRGNDRVKMIIALEGVV